MERKKTKTLVIIIFVVAAILGLTSVGIAYYYSQIKDVTPGGTNAAVCCGCYWVDPSTGNDSCSTTTPSDATAFNYGVIQSNGQCSATCPDRPGGRDIIYMGEADPENACAAYTCPADHPDLIHATWETPPACLCAKNQNFFGCSIDNVECNPLCLDVSVKDTNGNEVVAPLDPRIPLKISATFKPNIHPSGENGGTVEEVFTAFRFVINGETYDVDPSTVRKEGTGDATRYYPEITFTDFGTETTLNIQAFADDPLDNNITSTGCQRTMEVTQPKIPICSDLKIETTDLTETPVKVTKVTIQTQNISGAGADDGPVIKLKFKFNSDYGDIITKDISNYFVDSNTIVLNAKQLYPDAGGENIFENVTKFHEFTAGTLLPNGTYVVPVSVEVIVDGETINSSACTTSFTITPDTTTPPACNNGCLDQGEICDPTASPSSAGQNGCTADPNYQSCTNECKLVTTPPPACNNGCLDQGEVCDPSASPSSAQEKSCTADPNYQSCTPVCQLSNTSNFSVTKNGTTCVERMGANSTAQYTITIKNNDTDLEHIRSVKDKLPLGFTYIANSSTVNGAAVSDTGLVTVTNVGNSQEIVWQNPDTWSVQPGASLIIVFSARAGTSAITGANQNEVVVTPVNTPANPSTVRTEFVFQVAQTCSTPRTGLFDSTIGKVVAGFIVILLAITLYYTSAGEKIALYGIAFLEKSGLVEVRKETETSFRLLGLRLTYPRKYFEEKIIHDAEKKRAKKS